MTSQADFTEEEWARLKRAPFVAALGVSLADPGGPIEAVKETSAALRTVVNAATADDRGDLVRELAQAVQADAKERKNPIGGFKPARGVNAGVEILDELRAVNEILSSKASTEDAAAVRAWLLDVAQAAADAAKEGGFFGFHAQRVSEGEQKMLDSLGEALAG